MAAQVNLVEEEETQASRTNDTDAEKRFRFLEAIRNNNENEVLKSIKAGVDIDFVFGRGKPPLFSAVIVNNEKIVQALIDAGADVNITDDEGKTPLFYCAEDAYSHAITRQRRIKSRTSGGEQRGIDFSHRSVASLLIKAGADINIADDKDTTVLIYSLQKKNIDFAWVLIKAGADAKGTDKNGRNALIYASIYGNKDMILKLVTSVNINHTDNQGKTALMHAVENNQKDVVAELIEAGADVNLADKQGKTALIYCTQHQRKIKEHWMYNREEFYMPIFRENYKAISDSKTSMICMLIKAGADLNSRDYLGKTSLIYCAQRGVENVDESMYLRHVSYQDDTYKCKIDYIGLASELIKAGADVNMADNEGKTPLIYALQDATATLAFALLKAGADVNITDKGGKTALIYFAQYQTKPRKVKKRKWGKRNRLHMSGIPGIDVSEANATDNSTLFSMLINASSDINATDNEGKTALLHSLENNHESLAFALIKNGADVNVKDKEGNTTLIYCAKNQMKTRGIYYTPSGDSRIDVAEHSSLASVLIKSCRDINITDSEGKTALIYSLQDGNESMACALIEAGASINMVDDEGKTALFYATISSNKNLVFMLPDGLPCAYINRNQREEEAPLTDSVELPRENVILKLLDAGADVNITDNEGKSALMHYAENEYIHFLGMHFRRKDKLKSRVSQIENDYRRVASALIESCEDVNIVDKQGKTALAYFLQNNKDSCASALIDAGADVNIIDADGRTVLFYVPSDCDKVTIDKIIKRSNNINITDNQGETPLIHSLQDENESLACALIEAGADIKMIDKTGRNALFYAVRHGTENVFSKLMNSKDINITDNEGKTVLMYAVERMQTSLVSELINSGADVNVTDKVGKTALIYCAQNQMKSEEQRIRGISYSLMYRKLYQGKIDAIEGKNVATMLINAGAGVNVADNEGKTALIYSLQNGNERLSCSLIKTGADVNTVDGNGKTALLYAILFNNERVVHALLDAGADVNARDYEGKTALTYCAQPQVKTSERMMYRHHYMFRYHDFDPSGIETLDHNVLASTLIKAGTDINVTDNKGKTALIYSLQDGNESLARILIEARADVNVVDGDGKTALFYALTSNNDRVPPIRVRHISSLNISISDSEEEGTSSVTAQDRDNLAIQLIDAGADVNVVYDNGETALIYSAKNGDKSLVLALIKAGAHVNIADNKGRTALIHCACRHDGKIRGLMTLGYRDSTEFRSIASELIKADADVNMTDNEGKTALIYCVQNNNENMVSMLIEAGADVNITDHNGGTALIYGVGNESIVRKLIMDGKVQVNKRDRYGRLPLFYAITECLASARHLLGKGSGLHRKDCYNISILSFFIENCLRRCNYSHLTDGLNLLEEKGVQRETIFEALINSVFCKTLLSTLGLTGRRKSGSRYQKRDTKQIIQVLNLAKEYIAEENCQKCETIQNIIMTMEQSTDLCRTVAIILNSLIELGANPCYADTDGNTALHYATCLPFAGVPQETVIRICDKLDELGAPVDAKNHQNETPLLFCLSKVHWVERSDHESSNVKLLLEVCRFLLEQGSSVEETARNGKSVFHLIVELFQQGFRVRDDTIRNSVLNDSLTLMQLFSSSRVTKEVTVNKRDGSLNTPLHLWAMLQFSLPLKKEDVAVDLNIFEMQILASVFKHLLACGAKLNDRNGIERTPLHLCKTWTAAKLLIDAGAKTDVVDYVGSSPLLVALERNRIFDSDANCIYPDVLQKPKDFWKTVVEHKLDPWAVNSLGKSVMSILVQSEAFLLAKALLHVARSGNYLQDERIAVSLLNAICKDHSTRAQWKSILVEKILKSRKKDIAPRKGEDTPLHFCCKNIVKETDELFPPKKKRFLDLSGDIIANAMMTSVHWTIVKQLLAHGFDKHCDLPDGSGESCMDIARNCSALTRLLKKPINPDEAPLIIPWTSNSKTHKNALAKVARRQEYRQIDSFWYHENNIQKGSFGLVFVGINEKDGREVAIKRIEKLRMHRPEDKREITSLTKLADCEQVVRYLVFSEDRDFSYVVLELMEGNLKDYLEGTDYDPKKSIQLCADVVKGLKYLHKQNIIHRDLKPSNILYKTFPHLCLKIADFGLSRCIDKCSTSATVLGSVAGTRCWIAPEVLKSSYKEHSTASDVFSCGLVLHYIQVKRHPFYPADCANKIEQQICNDIENNVLKDNKEGWDASLCPEATELLRRMLDNDRMKRPTATEVLAHPFFWSGKKKMDFLISVGNQPEFQCPRAKRTLPLTPVEKDLDKNFGAIVTKTTWNDPGFNHMPAIYAEMTRKRKYCTTSVVELVRFIRNTHEHVSDDKRPTSIRQLVLEDFVFLEYFPKLVMEVFKSVEDHGWDSKEEIKYALDDTMAKGCDEGLPGEPSSTDSKRKHPKPQYGLTLGDALRGSTGLPV